MNGKRLDIDPGEYALSVAVANKRVALGASWSLGLYDAAGTGIWRRAAPDATWRVNQSADGRIVVAAFGDGTIRWYRAQDGKELLALQATPDGGAWAAFTPAGYYMASPQGEALMGWQVTTNLNAASDYRPASASPDMKGRFNRPDVVKSVLFTLDADY